VIQGSALAALEGGDPAVGHDTILALMKAVDEYIPQPERAKDRPFLMPIEDVFTISGRGTVVTGRVERGIVKVGDEVEIVGLQADRRRSRRVSRCSANCSTRARRGTISGSSCAAPSARKSSAAGVGEARVRSRRTRIFSARPMSH